MGTILVISSFPDAESAGKMAAALVEARLAACVNILQPCRSIYRWQGKTEVAQEVPLLIKTTVSCYARVEAAIRQGHPYELPEIIAVPVTAGFPAYLDWVVAETEKSQ